MSEERNGWALSSWSALQSLITIALVMLGGIAWGLKLESRIDQCQRDQTTHEQEAREHLSEIKDILAQGILPVTAARIDQLEYRMRRLEGERLGLRKE